ncbi:hypothetical protein LZ554_004700 [Drepanopeziza brunnea f. sp. 'monogermtubi']|nr:hypothetical protein LZ554_004700 [Drepanopeziza brunnea f. sp. 'monogermtubi']
MLSKRPPSSMSPTLRQRAPKAPSSSTSTSTPARGSSSSASPMFATSSGPDAQTPLLPTQSRSPAKPDARLIEPHPSLSRRPGTRGSGEGGLDREGTGQGQDQGKGDMENLSSKSQWIVLAIASGGCAAFNGVFAKLTTTELTTSFATWVANLVGLANVEGGVEVIVRALFFALNLIFNGIMWTLFTKALARGTSTTQVSILNTSANFMLTAVLGWVIFSESLPPLWFLGAALLVAGNINEQGILIVQIG